MLAKTRYRTCRCPKAVECHVIAGLQFAPRHRPRLLALVEPARRSYQTAQWQQAALLFARTPSGPTPPCVYQAAPGLFLHSERCAGRDRQFEPRETCHLCQREKRQEFPPSGTFKFRDERCRYEELRAVLRSSDTVSVVIVAVDCDQGWKFAWHTEASITTAQLTNNRRFAVY